MRKTLQSTTTTTLRRPTSDAGLVDTSAIIALLVPSDQQHQSASRSFAGLAATGAVLTTTSYVLVETYALLGRRCGLQTVERFREEFSPLMDVVWVEADLHKRGLDLLLRRAKSRLSLVDAVSFLVVQERHIDRVFVYDKHFIDEGFLRVD